MSTSTLINTNSNMANNNNQVKAYQASDEISDEDYSYYEHTLVTEKDDDFHRFQATDVSFPSHVTTVASNFVKTMALKTWDIFAYVIGMLVRI